MKLFVELKNRLISIVLVLCLVVPVGATSFWFRHHRKQTRREVKHFLMHSVEKSDLVLLKFSMERVNKDLVWKHAKEFEWGGSMYDIVEKTTTSDSVFYLCWPDKKETKLNKQLAEAVSIALGNSPQNKDRQQRLKRFYKSLFFDVGASQRPNRDPDEIANKPYSNLYQSVTLSEADPPPEVMA